MLSQHKIEALCRQGAAKSDRPMCSDSQGERRAKAGNSTGQEVIAEAWPSYC